jgi:hypothetical protein
VSYPFLLRHPGCGGHSKRQERDVCRVTVVKAVESRYMGARVEAHGKPGSTLQIFSHNMLPRVIGLDFRMERLGDNVGSL